ncbi:MULTISPECIES: GDSL-type esterase/lipase family protein [Allobacillus]|uniref:Lipolytic enzyme, G-D-S-L n=1 Tax=Allobacillus salarius TaxID=1955272 RepID=A0A556PN27_9BACI|nr:GDSL-type esterase/lipase family protein [Allobacillus salarius]TSJ65802.1 lipolytic enzyme, G-D-S-L [Allobacillus salarius]
MRKRIVCFGDSNTWGLNAETMKRFPENVRWTGLLQEKLSDEYQVIEEGLPGRTSVVDDPLLEGMNGIDYIVPCIKSHAPVELLIIMLGTNDTKERFGLTAHNIAQGITRLAKKAQEAHEEIYDKALQVLVIAPPMIGSHYKKTEVRKSMGDNCDIKSSELPGFLKEFVTNTNIFFLDASKEVVMNEIDYMHLDENGHKQLSELVLKKVRYVLS